MMNSLTVDMVVLKAISIALCHSVPLPRINVTAIWTKCNRNRSTIICRIFWGVVEIGDGFLRAISAFPKSAKIASRFLFR